MTNSSDPKVQALFTQLRMLFIAIGAVIAYAGYDASPAYKWVMMAGGAVLIIGPAIWDFIATVNALLHTQAVGVASGLNLAVSGKAVDREGNVISQFSPNAETPPRAPTIESAQEIVKAFSPSEPIEKS